MRGFAASGHAPLELSDGRVFQDWAVIRQTDDSLTIKHSKGAAKIMKVLLPPDVFLQYPIAEAPMPVPRPLPLEPAGLDKSVKGERSIGVRNVISDTDVRWTCRIAAKGTTGGITRASKNRAGEFKTDFVFPFDVSDVAPMEEAIAKARKWAASVADKKPPAFQKSMGQVAGHEWTFDWDSNRVVIRTGTSEPAHFEEQDLEKIQMLLSALPYLEKERLEEAKGGEDFAATLK